METVACYICQAMFPLVLTQEHHKTPQAVGKRPDNSDDNLVRLCAGCHHNLHRISEKIAKGRAGMAKDLAEAVCDSPASVRRMMELSVHAAEEFRAMKSKERELPEVVMVGTDVRRDVYVALHEMARSNGTRLMPWLRQHLTKIAEEYSAGYNTGNDDSETDFDITRIG